jgi:hypothetical protein
MDLHHFQEEAPGSVFWHPKGWTLFQTLIDYMRIRAALDECLHGSNVTGVSKAHLKLEDPFPVWGQIA